MRVDSIDPIDDPTVVFGDNFSGVDKIVCDRCARVHRLFFEIDESKIDEFAAQQLCEISDVMLSVFVEHQDPNLITPSMLEVLEGIYANQYDYSFEDRKKLFEKFCKTHNIDDSTT